MLACRMYIGNPFRLTAFRYVTVKDLRNPKERDGRLFIELNRHQKAHSMGPGIVSLSRAEVDLWGVALEGKSDEDRLQNYDRIFSAYIQWVSI